MGFYPVNPAQSAQVVGEYALSSRYRAGRIKTGGDRSFVINLGCISEQDFISARHPSWTGKRAARRPLYLMEERAIVQGGDEEPKNSSTYPGPGLFSKAGVILMIYDTGMPAAKLFAFAVLPGIYAGRLQSSRQTWSLSGGATRLLEIDS